MNTNRLSELLYQQPEEVAPDPFALPQGGMMMAQAKPQNKAYWDYRLKMNDFETPDEELFRRANQQQAPAQGGGYKTGSDYVQKPLTQEQIDAFRLRAMQEAAIRQRQMKR